MPLQVNLKTNAKPPREEYRSLDESRATLRAEGIDPDVIERSMVGLGKIDHDPLGCRLLS
jgi:hypothetical protein